MLYHTKPFHERGLPANASAFYTDILDGEAVKEIKSRPDYADTDVLIGIFADGVQPYRANDKYSMTPIVCTIFNMSPEER